MQRTRSRKHLIGTILLTSALIAGCAASTDSSDDGDDSGPAIDEGMVGTDSGGEPVEGGSLTWGSYAEPASLDPAETIAAAATGGVEMANIYDTLMRFDSEENEYVPQLAQSLEPDEDYQTWTLTLRDDVTFSNGDVLDAESVQKSQQRYASASSPEAPLWNANVNEITVEDDLVVVYELSTPWPGFASTLGSGPGMIVAEESGEVGEEDFEPIGAGPFELASWKPQEELVLEARQDYWNGEPPLDEVRAAYLNDQRAGLESLLSDGVDAAFVRYPDLVDDILDEDLNGYANTTPASNAALINAAEDRPGHDRRVRKAMQLAVQPQVLMDRAFDGKGEGTSAIFPEHSRWESETGGLPHDPERAKELVEEAKADGFDGTIDYVGASDPGGRDTAMTAKAQLEAVGFEVNVDLMRTIADQIERIGVEQDYDVGKWGLSFREADPFTKMFATMHSEGNQVYSMHTSDEMDSLIEEFQAAADFEDQHEIMDRIQQQVNEDVPYLTWGPFVEVTAWDSDVQGVVGGSNSMLMFDQAWVK